MPVSLAAGALGSHLFSSLPPLWLVIGATMAALALLLSNRFRLPALAVLAACWCLFNFQVRLGDRLDPSLTGQLIPVAGVISSIPREFEDYSSFRFNSDAQGRQAGLPRTLLVHWYRQRPELAVGQRWVLEMKLRPPWGSVNFQGVDREQWLFAEGIGGLGTVRNGTLQSTQTASGFALERLRHWVLLQISQRMQEPRQRGIVQALATADRSGLDARDSHLLTLTGTSHLLAISGLHIGLAAAGGMGLGRLLFWFMPFGGRGNVQILMSAISGLLVAVAYAALAGFGIPTVRAVVMLMTVVGAMLSCRSIHPFRAWTLALAAVLLTDPFAPLRAGFWFSFMAVAALIIQFAPRQGRLAWWKTLLLAQVSVLVVLLPVSAGWFQSFSPVGFIANLAAIPWVSLLVVPFVLAGIAVLPLSGTLAEVSWWIAGQAVEVLMFFLEILALLQGQLQTIHSPSGIHLALAALGGCLLLLPRGLPLRWSGIFLILPLLMPAERSAGPGEIYMEVIDAGQGTAVIVNAAGRTLLYDSGPGDGRDRNRVGSAIVPALNRLGGTAPERIVISHADLDHAGGLQSLQARYPSATYSVNLPENVAGRSGCSTPLEWRWRDAGFKVLHPTPALPYLGNDSSCVLSVRAGLSGLLLPGDISETVENRLILWGIQPHSVLIVPHHGSNTSSSQEFILKVRPALAIATAGLGNRFDFPRLEVRKRYEQAGVEFWSTGECGALRMILQSNGNHAASSARRQRQRIWRWPASDNCP
jgi:competence protein ComEC